MVLSVIFINFHKPCQKIVYWYQRRLFHLFVCVCQLGCSLIWVLSHNDDIIRIIVAKDQLTKSNNNSPLLVPWWPVALTSSCFQPVSAPIGPMTRFPRRLSSWHPTLTWHHNTKYWSVFFSLPLLKDIERREQCSRGKDSLNGVILSHTHH